MGRPAGRGIMRWRTSQPALVFRAQWGATAFLRGRFATLAGY